jgi:hypothetical protein
MGQENKLSVETDLDHRIRDLCAKAVSASEDDWHEILAELQKALHRHNDGLRKLVGAGPTGKTGK